MCSLPPFSDLYRAQRRAKPTGARRSELAALLHSCGENGHGDDLIPRDRKFSFFREKGAELVAGFPRLSQPPSPYHGYSLVTNPKSDLDEEFEAVSRIPRVATSGGQLADTLPRRVLLPAEILEQAKLEGTNPIFPWVESTWFQTFVGVVIFFNSIVIGLETDIETLWIWWYLEQILIVFFCFELTVRLVRHRLRFFQDEDDRVWNILDLCIVLSGVTDQWIQPIIEHFRSSDGQSTNRMGVILLLMRMLRLLRIVRLFRLVRIVRPLYELAQGVLEAVQSMFWVLVFTGMIIYAIAIICTRLIGHGHALPDQITDPELLKIQQLFSNVGSSMFALFGSMSSWSLYQLTPLFIQVPFLEPCFVLFYVYSAWALLAVMTGVVSENMVAIRESMTQEDAEKEQLRRTMAHGILLEFFNEADEDRSGSVSREEFDMMLRKPELVKKFTRHTNIRVEDLYDLYDCVDREGTGNVSIDDFMEGFKFANEPLGAKGLVKLQENIAGDLKGVERSTDEKMDKVFQELDKVVVLPLRKVHAITEQMQNLDRCFRDLLGGLQGQVEKITAKSAIPELEDRILARMDGVHRELDALERKAKR